MRIFNFLRVLAVPAAILTAGTPAMAATLKIGDPAPPLQVAKWVQGDPVQTFDSNHVYIIEFWATWYAPGQSALARLNGIWQKYKDKGLIAIGQDVFEQDDSGVPAFINTMNDKITYPVALDDKSRDKEGAMAVNWMKAAGQSGVPTAFIINRQGRIVWIGHPMALSQSIVEEILSDEFDVDAYAKEFEKQQLQKLQQQILSQKLSEALKAKDWDAADSVVTKIAVTMPESVRHEVSPVRLQILLHRKDYAGAYELARSSSEASPSDAYLQNELAWALVTTGGVDRDGIALAEKIAERANNASSGKAAGILDTLARAQFMNGQTNEAVASEQKAVDAAPDEIKANLKRSLASYQQGKLPEVGE